MKLKKHGKIALSSIAVMLAAGAASALTLEEGFKTPPNSAKPRCSGVSITSCFSGYSVLIL